MIKTIPSFKVLTEKFNNFVEDVGKGNQEIYALALPSLHRTVTATFIFTSAIKSMQWSFANFNTLLPSISLLLPLTKCTTDMISNKFQNRVEEKKLANNALKILDKICVISSQSILAYALFSQSNHFLTTLGLASLLFHSIENSLNQENNLEAFIPAAALEAYFAKLTLVPIFNIAKQFLFKQSPTFNPLTQCPSTLPNPFMSPMGLIPDKAIEIPPPVSLFDQMKTLLFSNVHNPSTIATTNPPLIEIVQESQVPAVSSASSNALTLFSKDAFVEKIKSYVPTTTTNSQPVITRPTDLSTTSCETNIFSTSKNVTIENLIPASVIIEPSAGSANITPENLSSTNTSATSYFTLPVLAGIAATAILGYAALKLYRKYLQEKPSAPAVREIAPTVPEPQKTITSPNEQLHRFQKVNAEYYLSEIQAASASLYNKKRYFIIRYTLSTAKFAKALIFNVARCIGYVALSSLLTLTIVTQKGRSYLKTNVAHVFTNLTGIFISCLGIASPFLGSAAYVAQIKMLYPILSNNKENLNTTRIHQFIQAD